MEMTGDCSWSSDFERFGDVGAGLFLFMEKELRGPKVRKPVFGLSCMLGVAMDEKLLRCFTPGGMEDGYETGGEPLPGGVCFGPNGSMFRKDRNLGMPETLPGAGEGDAESFMLDAVDDGLACSGLPCEAERGVGRRENWDKLSEPARAFREDALRGTGVAMTGM